MSEGHGIDKTLTRSKSDRAKPLEHLNSRGPGGSTVPTGVVNGVAAATEEVVGASNKHSCSLLSMKKEDACHEDEAVSSH